MTRFPNILSSHTKKTTRFMKLFFYSTTEPATVIKATVFLISFLPHIHS